MSIGIGIVGLGRISGLHIDGYESLAPEARVVAVSDTNAERAAAVAGELGARAVTFEDMLVADDVDAIEILVPSFAQAPLAFAVLAAGKHLTVQKPVAGDVATAQRLVDAADAAGVQFRVFENTVNAPSWLLAEKLIADDAIGTPSSIYLRWANSLLSSGWDVPAEASAWRHRGEWASQFAAPALFDDSAHLLSPAVALFGEVREVIALSGDHRIGDRQTGFPYAIAWHHQGGGQALVEGTLSDELVVLTEQYSADTSITITGSKGLLWINTGEGRAADRPVVEVASGGTLKTYEADHRWAAAWPEAQKQWIGSMLGDIDERAYRWTGRQALSVLRGSLMVDEAVRAARARTAGA